jgi:hypothetical protein
MNRMISVMKWMLLLTAVLGILLGGCKSQSTTTTAVVKSAYQLEYRLFSNFPNLFWCDPDSYPVARDEQPQAIALFTTIRADQAEFSAILEFLRLTNKTDYTDGDKLLIYKEHKKLNYAAQLTAADGAYNFNLRVDRGQGERIEGIIKTSGEVQITKREVSVNTCPICLAVGTLIDTPEGGIPVEQLAKGMLVYSLDTAGNRIVTEILDTSATPVPVFFKIIKVELNDGRTLTASPEHPTAGGIAVVEYKAGDELDGAQIISSNFITYESSRTYDILPSGTTGLYWANGILLKSTLKIK